jgi:hypothetical protein
MAALRVTFSENSISDTHNSRKLAGAIDNDKALGKQAKGFYRYSVFSTSLNATNHHLNLLA